MRARPKFIRSALLLFGILIVVGGGVSVRAQADDDPIFGADRRKKEDPPSGLQENLSRMRIEKDKKDFIEMVKRGDDAAKLASQLKEDPASGQQGQISNIGKLVKKIREELGAEGSINDDDTVLPGTTAAAIRDLKEQVNGLAEDLKKTNRFTVSAAAIDRTNAILRLVKYLHG